MAMHQSERAPVLERPWQAVPPQSAAFRHPTLDLFPNTDALSSPSPPADAQMDVRDASRPTAALPRHRPPPSFAHPVGCRRRLHRRAYPHTVRPQTPPSRGRDCFSDRWRVNTQRHRQRWATLLRIALTPSVAPNFAKLRLVLSAHSSARRRHGTGPKLSQSEVNQSSRQMARTLNRTFNGPVSSPSTTRNANTLP